MLPEGSRLLAKGGTRHLRFLIPPLATPPDLPLAATPFGRAAKIRGSQLKPRYNPWRSAAVWGWLRAWVPRIQMRGSRAEKISNDYPACTDRPRTVMRGKSRKITSTAHKKGERRTKIYALLRILDARPQGVAASGRSGGVARGDRKPWCPIPFCPLPPGGGKKGTRPP